jgi:hypothetical protein
LPALSRTAGVIHCRFDKRCPDIARCGNLDSQLPLRHQHNIDVNIGTNIRVRAVAAMRRSKLSGATSIEMEDLAMSLIRNGYAVSTRRGFSGALLSALVALALCYPGAATAQQTEQMQEIKQIKLTDKHIQGFVGAAKGMAKIYEGVNPDKPDPKLDAQAAALAKKNGFASLDEFEGVSTNIAVIMSGIDPQTKKFTEPPEQIRKEMAALRADKSVPEADKKQGLAQLEALVKVAKPIQFKENIALVLKYFDKLSPLMPS